jgi:hypothetical protein
MTVDFDIVPIQLIATELDYGIGILIFNSATALACHVPPDPCTISVAHLQTPLTVPLDRLCLLSRPFYSNMFVPTNDQKTVYK